MGKREIGELIYFVSITQTLFNIQNSFMNNAYKIKKEMIGYLHTSKPMENTYFLCTFGLQTDY